MEQLARVALLLVALAVLAAPAANAQTLILAPDTQPGIGDSVQDVIRELRRMGFPMHKVETTGRTTRWAGERPTARAYVTATAGRVTEMELDVDMIQALADDPTAVAATTAWQARFIPEAMPLVAGTISEGSGIPGGLVIQGQLLHDRWLRAEVSAGPTHLGLRLAPRSARFDVDLWELSRDACRALDPVTGRTPERLVVPHEATVVDPGGPRARLWVVLYDEDPVAKPFELGELSWGPIGIVADAASRTIVLPGPPIGEGEKLNLRWDVILPDTDRHEIVVWFVPGPIPEADRLEEQAAAIRTSLALASGGASYANRECALTDEDPVQAMVREHIAAAILALDRIRERQRAVGIGGGDAGMEAQLAPLAEMRDWAVAERDWADEEIPGRMRSDNPTLTEWRTMLGVAATLLTDVVATRIDDPEAATAALLAIDSLLDSVGPRVALDLGPPLEPDPLETPRPVLVLATAP